jgi:hypothetical protein
MSYIPGYSDYQTQEEKQYYKMGFDYVAGSDTEKRLNRLR